MESDDDSDKTSGKNVRYLSVPSNYPQVPQGKTSVTVAPTAPGPTTTSRLEQLQDLQVEFRST